MEVSENGDSDGIITMNMPDNERAEILKNTNLEVVEHKC